MDDPQYAEDAATRDIEAAVAAMEAEHRKLREFQRELDEASTTVRSKDRMLSATFDGRGELTELKFHTGRYRDMAPAELGSAIKQIVTEGRATAMRAMAELENAPTLPGVDLAELASGKADLSQVMAALLGPFFATPDEPDPTAHD